jgi:hypothetical protein
MKFPIIVVLRFYPMEQMWAAEDTSKAMESFRIDRTFKNAEQVLELSRTCVSRRIIAEGNTTKSQGGQTVFTPGNKKYMAL